MDTAVSVGVDARGARTSGLYTPKILPNPQVHRGVVTRGSQAPPVVHQLPQAGNRPSLVSARWRAEWHPSMLPDDWREWGREDIAAASGPGSDGVHALRCRGLRRAYSQPAAGAAASSCT